MVFLTGIVLGMVFFAALRHMAVKVGGSERIRHTFRIRVKSPDRGAKRFAKFEDEPNDASGSAEAALPTKVAGVELDASSTAERDKASLSSTLD